MCSVQDVEDVVQECKQQRPSEVCMKCGEKSMVVIRVSDGFCRDCFLHYCNHKFRSAFGKTKVVRHNERVLVAYSGGHASAALLHMLQLSLGEKMHKKFKVRPGLVHIDETTVTNPGGESENYQRLREIGELMAGTGLPCHSVQLSEAFTSTEESNQNGTDANERLKSAFDTIKTNTGKEDYLRHLRSLLLRSIARKEGYTKLVVGDSASRMAVTVLSNVAQGRGAHLPLDAAFADDRENDLITVRPMREFTAKEIAVYNVLNDVTTVTMTSIETMAAEKSSIQRLTESFVTGLQADFPATVSTVCRTGNKMKFHANASNQSCAFCKAPLDTRVGDASALHASEFSAELARPPTQPPTQPESPCHESPSAGACCGDGDGSCQTKNTKRVTKEELTEALCYGCRRLTKDMTSIHEALPDSVEDHVTMSTRRSVMRASIQDFLLDDR